jgi:hypothetical protein
MIRTVERLYLDMLQASRRKRPEAAAASSRL